MRGWLLCLGVLAFGVQPGATALAQSPPADEGRYMGQGTTSTDRTDVESTLPRQDTTIVGPMDPPPAGVIGNARPPQGSVQPPAEPVRDIVAVVRGTPELSTFAKLVEVTGVVATLRGAGPITVLAPSNAAFAKLPPAQRAAFLAPANDTRLQQILLYHVVPAAAPIGSFKGTKRKVPSVKPGATLIIDGTGDGVKVNDATVVRALRATNGIVHVIDSVLMAPRP